MCVACGVTVCFWNKMLNFLSRFLYLIRVSLRSLSSIKLWMYGQVLFQEPGIDADGRSAGSIVVF